MSSLNHSCHWGVVDQDELFPVGYVRLDPIIIFFIQYTRCKMKIKTNHSIWIGQQGHKNVAFYFVYTVLYQVII